MEFINSNNPVVYPQFVAGDTIEFTFQLPSYIKNPISVQHTVTQSTFENPCSPKLGGFDTGIQTTDTTGPSFTLAVCMTQFKYLPAHNRNPRSTILNHYGSYCALTGCFKCLINFSDRRFYSYTNKDCNSGMVLAVNPPTSGQTAAAFQDAAKSATIITPTSSSVLPSGTNTIISATNTATGSHASASNIGNAVKSNFIAGITLGAAVAAAIMH
jgi:hypothetical protein